MKQFFTQVQDPKSFKWKWFPIDHFFYARYVDNRGAKGFYTGVKKVTPVAWIEAAGGEVFVIKGKGKSERFPDYPSALRRLADIIEHDIKINGARDALDSTD